MADPFVPGDSVPTARHSSTSSRTFSVFSLKSFSRASRAADDLVSSYNEPSPKDDGDVAVPMQQNPMGDEARVAAATGIDDPPERTVRKYSFAKLSFVKKQRKATIARAGIRPGSTLDYSLDPHAKPSMLKSRHLRIWRRYKAAISTAAVAALVLIIGLAAGLAPRPSSSPTTAVTSGGTDGSRGVHVPVACVGCMPVKMTLTFGNVAADSFRSTSTAQIVQAGVLSACHGVGQASVGPSDIIVTAVRDGTAPDAPFLWMNSTYFSGLRMLQDNIQDTETSGRALQARRTVSVRVVVYRPDAAAADVFHGAVRSGAGASGSSFSASVLADVSAADATTFGPGATAYIPTIEVPGQAVDVSPTPSISPGPASASPTPTPSGSGSTGAQPSPSNTPTGTPSPTPSSSGTPSNTPSASMSPSHSSTPTRTPSRTPSNTPTPTSTKTTSASPTSQPSSSSSPTPSHTSNWDGSATPSPSIPAGFEPKTSTLLHAREGSRDVSTYEVGGSFSTGFSGPYYLSLLRFGMVSGGSFDRDFQAQLYETQDGLPVEPALASFNFNSGNLGTAGNYTVLQYAGAQLGALAAVALSSGTVYAVTVGSLNDHQLAYFTGCHEAPGCRLATDVTFAYQGTVDKGSAAKAGSWVTNIADGEQHIMFAVA